MDEVYMKLALALGRQGRGLVNPNPMVGAVVVKNGVIIGQGYHQKYGGPHAEVHGIEQAGADAAGATLYVTLEPCCHRGKTPPCTDLLIERKIKKVVIGALDPNPLVSGAGVAKLQQAGIEVVTGVLQEECLKLIEVFRHYIQTELPFVVLKTAMSLDGKIATASGESQWITGKAARDDVQLLRGELAGIMVGINTVLLDDPRLTCRVVGGHNPRRIIVDSNLRIELTSKVLQDQEDNQTIIAVTEAAPMRKRQLLQEKGVQIVVCRSLKGRVDLQHLMKLLGDAGLDSILLEGGSELNFSALEQGIVSKMITYIAPKVLGGTGKTPVGGLGVNQMDQAYRWRFEESIENIGGDLKITAYPEVISYVHRNS